MVTSQMQSLQQLPLLQQLRSCLFLQCDLYCSDVRLCGGLILLEASC
jgi:hypothetical protein